MYCKACGESISDDCRFCPICGESQVDKAVAKGTEAGNGGIKEYIRDVVEDVGGEIVRENIGKAEKQIIKKVKKTAKKATHNILVKVGVEKKNLGDYIHDISKKKR